MGLKSLFTLTFALATITSARQITLFGGMAEQSARDALAMYNDLSLLNEVPGLGLVLDGSEIAGIGFLNDTGIADMFPALFSSNSSIDARNTDTCTSYVRDPTVAFLKANSDRICAAAGSVGGPGLGAGIGVIIDKVVCKGGLTCTVLLTVGAASAFGFGNTEIQKDCKAGINNIQESCPGNTGMDHADDVHGFTTQIKTSASDDLQCGQTKSKFGTCKRFDA